MPAEIPPASPHRVAYQGEAGAFSEEALHAWFGDGVRPLPRRDFDALVAAVAEGEAEYGVLPVENTLAGTVGPACDAFLDAELTVVGEIVHPVRHCLLAPPGATLDGLTAVRSHPVALAQCRRFLANRPGLEPVAVHDTAGAARQVAEAGDPTVGAIASAAAGTAYGLDVLARDLQDRDDNQTRFWVIAAWGTPEARAPAARGTKSLLAFATQNRTGALVRVLRTLAEAGLNLTSLVARPGSHPWTYRFLAETDGDLTRGSGAEAVDEARGYTEALRVLGPYGVLTSADPSGTEDAAPSPAMAPGPAAPVPGTWSPDEELAAVRQGIDDIDQALIRMLARRRALAGRAQALRTARGRLLRDPQREARVLRQAVERGRTLGLPEEGVRRLYWSVVALCVPDLSEAPSRS
jgi:prephenate dehydratase